MSEIARLREALTMSDARMRLMFGEMTAQEIRTVRAALGWVKGADE